MRFAFYSLLVVFVLLANPALGEEFAITIDDPHCGTYPGYPDWNERLLKTLAAHRHQAALFVCGKRVDSPQGRRLLQTWDQAGHLLGNHSYNHYNLNRAEHDAAEFEAELLRTDKLLAPYRHRVRWFRFPYLKAGESAAKRDKVRNSLRRHGYKHGYVTIDASDWAINSRLVERLKKNPNADLSPYRDFYLEHMWARARYYSALAREVKGRPVKHTVLLHHSLLNSLFLNDLIENFESKGWKLTDASQVYQDPIFSEEPDVLPAGESIIWSLAQSKKHPGLRYPAEDAAYEKARMDALGL